MAVIAEARPRSGLPDLIERARPGRGGRSHAVPHLAIGTNAPIVGGATSPAFALAPALPGPGHIQCATPPPVA